LCGAGSIVLTITVLMAATAEVPPGSLDLKAIGTADVAGAEGLNATVARQPAGHVLVTVYKERAQLTWASAIDLLQAEEPALRDLLSEVLARLPFDAYFWECPPVSRSTAGERLFSFVALRAPHLASIGADDGPFEEHLAQLRGQPVAKTFPNLGGDSWLVAPAEASDDMQTYAHVANFFRRAPPAQRDAQWRELGEAVRRRLEASPPDRNVWVSTEGSGVYWLHMRLDPRPKYYHHAAFRDPKYGLPAGEL